MSRDAVEQEPRGEPPITLDVLDASSRRERIARWIWGYDIFISYSWADGGDIATELEQALRDAKFRVFRDRGGVHAGDRLGPTITRAVRRSSCVLVVATPGAIGARWVAAEVALADRLGRTTIPLACGDTVASVDALHPIFRERLRIERPSPPFVDQGLVSAIASSLGSLRQARARFVVVSAVLVVVTALAIVAAVMFGVASYRRDQAQHAQHTSEAERLALASSVARLHEDPVEALLLAVEAVRASPRPLPSPVETSLRDALATIGGTGVPVFDRPVRHIFEIGPGIVAASSPQQVATWQTSAPTARNAEARTLLIVPDDQDAIPVSVESDGTLTTWASDGTLTLLPLAGFDPENVLAARPCGVAEQSADGGTAELWTLDGSLAVPRGTGRVVSLAPSCRDVALKRGDDLVVAHVDGQSLLDQMVVHLQPDQTAWSDDGSWLAIATGTGVSVISARTRKLLALALPGAPRPFHRLAFAPSSSTLTAIDDRGTVTIWSDVEATGAQPLKVVALPDYSQSGNALETTLAFSPDGRWLLASDSTREAAVIDLDKNAAVHTLFRLDQNGLTTVPALRSPFAFTRDSKVLFIVNDRDLIDVWALGAEPIRVTELHGHDGGFTALRVLSDGTLVTGGLDGMLRRWGPPPGSMPGVWDLSRAQWRASPIEMRGDSVGPGAGDGLSSMHVAFGPGDEVIASGSAFPLRETRLVGDGSVAPWTPLTSAFDSLDGAWTLSCVGHGGCSRCDDINPIPLPMGMSVIAADPVYGAVLLRGSHGGTFAVWDPGKAMLPVAVQAPSLSATAVAISAHDRRVLWRDDDRWMYVADGDEAVEIDDTGDRADFCLDGEAVCASHIHWLDSRHPDADRDPDRVATQLDTGSCLAFVGDRDARVIGPSCARTINVPDITGIRCDRDCARWAVGTHEGALRWMTPAGSTDVRLAPMSIHDVAWADDSGLVVATRPSAWVDTDHGTPRVVDLWPQDVDSVAASANERWIALGGDDQVLRFYLRSIDELVALAKKTAGRSLSDEERARWRIDANR